MAKLSPLAAPDEDKMKEGCIFLTDLVKYRKETDNITVLLVKAEQWGDKMTELGTVLDGKYEILKKVGQGGMSIVYLAMDNRLNNQWAVKEIKNDGSKSVETLLKGLEREAYILKNVDHPVMPRIVDIFNENGTI